MLNSCRPGGFVVYGFTAKIVATVSNGFRVLMVLMVFTVFLDLGALGFIGFRLGIDLLVVSRECGKMVPGLHKDYIRSFPFGLPATLR